MPNRVVTEPARDRGPAILAPAHFGGYPGPVRESTKGSQLIKLLGTTDAKQIGLLYLVTSFGFFLIGGVLALLLRGELAEPGMQFLSPEQYNQAFTMHGTIMLLLFATPLVFAFGNYIVPLQIGAPDVSFPRLNAFAYWLYLFGGSLAVGGFFTPGGAADFGWFAYTPLSNYQHSPGVGGNMWIMGLVISGLGTILGAVNMITTVLTLRAPGMTMFRMPIFTWNLLLTSVLVILVFPLLAAALLALGADRLLHAHVFDPTTGGPMLWQHLFWFFGHPEVYIVALPFFGIITEIIPVFSRKPIFGYTGLVLATISITVLSMSVWAHHMFGTGQVLLPFFSILSYLIAVPTGVKFFNWIGTMWKGQITFETPMLFSVGFLVTFLLGGLTGVMLASPPADFHLTDTYFVVAHFHYVLFGTIVFAAFAGVYFWFPKMTGRLLDERLGKIHFWTMFVGFHVTFLVQHWLGAEGMPRRYADYLPSDGFTTLNAVSTIGSFILGVSTLFFMYNVWKSWRYGARVTVDDPWGFGNSLEWATTCPPPLRNFDRMPRIRSERPAFDAKYGPLVADLGRDLPQRTTKPPQHFAEELHHVPRAPESPAAEGAHGAREAVEYQPAPLSGARPVDVPEPEEIIRPSFEETDEPEETILGAQREPEHDDRWRHPRGPGDTTES
ncbi:aa3-type cytochrome oxidase subunit I [Micromonospora narathiwatensis]|uniref:Cytochrome c oxidase subunit 1 n=1 Tax=Micromonospora narathiwatensis TaxID=299146 RepID=A0A1A8ZCS3_9ACTN|nr:cytochrome c oxidase subunit I [Micromonospora narathiwatensis]SBT41625.1 cytochrome c oxidase subunit 1 [Micromonospora narathiwatensis]